jgi:ubiquinone/menaquinone biosynthesis C-methylase UbiE
MQLRDAVAMLSASRVNTLGPTTWADLGCGDGTFTRALAELLAPGSVVHAMDVHRVALRSLPARHANARIETHAGDFTKQPWPFGNLDGILMANSLHYVRDQEAFIADARARLTAPQRFLIVEYDTDTANPWVPYPVSLKRLATLFDAEIDVLNTRPSRYQRAALYAAQINFAARD